MNAHRSLFLHQNRGIRLRILVMSGIVIIWVVVVVVMMCLLNRISSLSTTTRYVLLHRETKESLAITFITSLIEITNNMMMIVYMGTVIVMKI